MPHTAKKNNPGNALLPLCQLAVDRALLDLRRGFPILVRQADGAVLAVAAEFLELARERLHAMLPASMSLIVTAARAQSLDITASRGRAVSLALGEAETSLLQQVIDPLLFRQRNTVLPSDLKVESATAAQEAALQLAKLGSLLPAVLAVTLPAGLDTEKFAAEHALLTVDAAAVNRYREALAATLLPVGRARVPLHEAHDAEVIAFRPQLGIIEHLAVLVGKPGSTMPPLVRMHSSCMTGDILASLRCDCGEQLSEALRRMSEAGAGILLYLNQEGRGIGIANKLRAYTLQDAGLDTVEANEELGFDADERHYQPAAEMLKQLGFTKVRLLTNNPEKVKELERYGITVIERVPLVIEAGEHNRGYLATKAKKCGHLL